MTESLTRAAISGTDAQLGTTYSPATTPTTTGNPLPHSRCATSPGVSYYDRWRSKAP